ncbi:MAG: hypothetical protein M3277_12180, partial [Actinomycetota bacterium]|nr:hypothetical protein [Actinomycetota bacterium]
RTLIAVAMGSQDATADARRLLDHGWNALANMSLIAAGAPVATLVFDPSGATRVTAADSVRGPADPTALTIDFQPATGVTPPIAPGEEVGTVRVFSGEGELVGTVPGIATTAVERAETSWAEQFMANMLRTAGAVLGW